MNEDQDWVRCSCCGTDVPDDEEHNTDHGVVPNPHDVGFGMCVECGGDKRAGKDEKPMTESAFKRRIGWAGQMFYEARFDVIEKNLRPDLAAKFRAMTYSKKCSIVAGMVEKGYII